jgi:hypothetical protein
LLNRLRREQLTEAEKRVISAAERGASVDLAPATAAGAQIIWTGEVSRTVRAGVLKSALLGTASSKPRPLRLRGAQISGKFDISEEELIVPLDLQECIFEQPVSMTALTAPTVRLRGCHLPGLNAGRLTTRDLEANEGFEAGWIDLLGAKISGCLDLSGAKLQHRDGIALQGSGMTVGWYAAMSSGFAALGAVQLIGARIGGHLAFTGATIENPGGNAIDAQSASVGFALFLGSTLDDPSGFRAQGGIRLVDARIDGFVCCWDAEISNPDGAAIMGQGLNVRGGLLLNRGFTAIGSVGLDGAHIEGDIYLTQATIKGGLRPALTGELVQVGASIWLGDGTTVEGTGALGGAKIAGLISLTGADLSRCPSLDLSGITAQALVMNPARPPAEMDLRHAHVEVLIDTPETWPPVHLQDFTYDQLEESGGDPPIERRLAWLCKNPTGYSPQPYEQLISLYRRTGHERAARRVGLAKLRAQRGVLGPIGKAWGVLLDVTVGYGYRTWLAGIWLLALIITGGLIFTADQTAITATKQPTSDFNSYAYAADLLIPVLNLGIKSTWTAHGTAAYWSWALTTTGWILTTAVVAGVTRAFRRD